jgi:carboxynorspermidine decarboxylase
MPEVFEFQFSPDVAASNDDGKYQYLLAGCSCLAGDLFGEYSFDEPLEIGSRVVFENMGAYTSTKWHYFNGINLPTIYSLTSDGQLVLEREFTYEEFARRNGVESYAAL